jgi:23S rRNA (adenine2503-C2)-methyltransferase
MGMGEPFLNYENTIGALKILTDNRGLGIPSRKITVSTVGFNQKIRKFADDLVTENNKSIKNIKLALSLHSTNQGIRESIIPVSKLNRLNDLYKELVYFYRTTGTKITYEYIFFPGINDTEEDIKRIVKLSGMIPCNFNLIPFHRIGYELKPPLDIFNNSKGTYNSLLINSLNYFISKLKSKKVIINLRSSSGIDINAACGQLVTNFKK